MSIRIDFLSYEGERNNERHPHAQFVLPIAGELEISIGGAEGRLIRRPACESGPQALRPLSGSYARTGLKHRIHRLPVAGMPVFSLYGIPVYQLAHVQYSSKGLENPDRKNDMRTENVTLYSVDP